MNLSPTAAHKNRNQKEPTYRTPPVLRLFFPLVPPGGILESLFCVRSSQLTGTGVGKCGWVREIKEGGSVGKEMYKVREVYAKTRWAPFLFALGLLFF